VRTGGYASIVDDGIYENRDDDTSATVRQTIKTGWVASKDNRQQKKADRLSRRSGQAPE